MHYTLFFIADFLFLLFHLIIYMSVQTPTSFRERKFCRLFSFFFVCATPERNHVKVTKPLRHRNILLRWSRDRWRMRKKKLIVGHGEIQILIVESSLMSDKSFL